MKNILTIPDPVTTKSTKCVIYHDIYHIMIRHYCELYGVLEAVPGVTQLNDNWEPNGPLRVCNSVQMKQKKRSLS